MKAENRFAQTLIIYFYKILWKKYLRKRKNSRTSWEFFKNIRFENRDKKWFKFLLSGKEWDPMMKSADLLQQIEEAKK